MTPEQFVYWMQGFVELNSKHPPSPEQWESICDHLQTVFIKVTPTMSQLLYPPLYPNQMPTQPPDYPLGTIIC